jgi:hypothetical protein
MEQTAGPDYYRRGCIEPWDFIRDQGLNYHLGNAVKYISRAGYKHDKTQDLKKAIHYLENELQHTLLETESLRSSDRIPERLSGIELSFKSFDSEEFDR